MEKIFFLISFIINLLVNIIACAETMPAFRLPNFKVGEAYTMPGDVSKSIVRPTWQELCFALKLRPTDVPNGKFCENALGNATYPQVGDMCVDGTFRVPAWNEHCDDIYPYCLDNSWTLSSDGKTCSRPTPKCHPNINAVSEEKLLAAIAYGESSTSNIYEEMAGIASAILRAKNARRSTSLNQFVLIYPDYSTVTKNGNQRFTDLMCSDNEYSYSEAYLAARNALQGGQDYSNGGCFWDGVDLKSEGENHYRYKTGFRFTKSEHNIFSVKAPPSLHIKLKSGYYDTVYDSTAAHGRTIFWKYNHAFLKAFGGKQCI